MTIYRFRYVALIGSFLLASSCSEPQGNLATADQIVDLQDSIDELGTLLKELKDENVALKEQLESQENAGVSARLTTVPRVELKSLDEIQRENQLGEIERKLGDIERRQIFED